MQEAEAAAVAEQLGEEPAEQPRNELGQFASEDAAADESAEPVAAPEAEAAATLLAGKYKTQEDLERGYLEQKAVLDRQGAELGELRRAFEEQMAALTERLDTPAPVPHRQITQNDIESNPAHATQVAYEQGDQTTATVAFEQWKLEDPAGASAWWADKRIEENEKKIRAEFETRFKQFEDQVAPIQAKTEQAELAQQVASLSDDARAFLTADNGSLVAQLATEFPIAKQAIETGTPAQKIEAINMLHGIHRGRTADTLTKASADVARTVAQEAQAVREDAYVASASTSEAESLTWEQQEQERARQAFTRRAGIWDAALVRPGK